MVHQIQTKSSFNSQVWGFLRLAPITQLELFGEHDFTASEKAELVMIAAPVGFRPFHKSCKSTCELRVQREVVVNFVKG